jgi:uncharacterized protein YukE
MDSSQVHVDPEQMRAFADILGQFAQRVKDFDGKVSLEMERLGNTFGGEDYRKFREAFTSSRQVLKRFIEETKKVVPDLKKDADTIAELQRINLSK